MFLHSGVRDHYSYAARQCSSACKPGTVACVKDLSYEAH